MFCPATHAEPVRWLVYPVNRAEQSLRTKRQHGVFVWHQHWRPACIEGARQLGLSLERVDALPLELASGERAA